MGKYIMPDQNFLVFEGSNTCLNMNKISVFRNGIDMPWTYYEAEMTDPSSQYYFMWTSKSAPGPNGEEAGKYVSEITRHVPYGNNSATRTMVKQTKSNPTMADFKEWGWPIKQDKEGNDI